MPRPRHPRIHLRRRQLAALPRLRALRELDLDVVGLGEVQARHAESTGRDLLDRTAPLGVQEPVDVLAALARVRLPAEAVHRNGERLVRLFRDRAVAHRPGREALHDRRHRFDLIDRHRLAQARPQGEQPAEGLQLRCLVVDELRVLPEDVVPARPRGVLQAEDRLGVEQVRRTVTAPLILAAGPESLVRAHCGVLRVGVRVPRGVLRRDHIQRHAAELRLGAGEVLVDELVGQADGFEHLRARVRRHGRDAHLGHDLQDALAERVDQVLDGLLGRDPGDVAGAHEVFDRLHREVGVDRGRAVTDQRRDVMHLADVSGLDHETALHARLVADEVVVHGREHEQGRDRREVLVRVAVAQDDELGAVLDRLIDLGAHLRDALLHALVAGLDAIETADRDRRAAGQGGVDVLDLGQLVVVDHGEIECDGARVIGAPAQQVAFRTEAEGEGGDDLLADRVQRRVGHLRELLGEVIEQQAGTVAEDRDRRVGAHRAERLRAVLTHRREEDAHFLLRVAEGALTARDRRDRVHDVLALGEVRQAHPSRVEPLLPGLEVGELSLDLVLFDDAPLGGVDEEHATGAQASAALDALGGEVEHAGLAADHDEPVGRLGPPPGAEPVAVERRADQRAVGEDQCRGAVPGLHLHRVVVVERAQLRIDVRLLLVRLRHHHHDRVRQAAPGQGEQLEHLVERRGVARTRGADGQERTDVAEQLGFELRLARPHPVAVSVDRVDLAVVRQHAQRLRERPGRERVGRVPGVHDGQLGGESLVLQVGVERLELKRRDHALVPEGAGRQRHDVRAQLGAGALAQPEHAAVEPDAREGGRIAHRGTRDEQLLEHRARVERELAEVLLGGRHVAPAQQHEVLAFGDLLDARLLGGAALVVARQEDHARGVLPHRGQLEVDDRAEEGVGHLRQDAGTVTRARIRSDRAAVLEVAQRRQGEIDDVVPRFAAQGRDHGEPARVLLEGRVVHPLLGGKRAEGVVCGAVIVPVKTKARRHTYRPHIDAQDGTTSALNCGS